MTTDVQKAAADATEPAEANTVPRRVLLMSRYSQYATTLNGRYVRCSDGVLVLDNEADIEAAKAHPGNNADFVLQAQQSDPAKPATPGTAATTGATGKPHKGG